MFACCGPAMTGVNLKAANGGIEAVLPILLLPLFFGGIRTCLYQYLR